MEVLDLTLGVSVLGRMVDHSTFQVSNALTAVWSCN